MTTFNPKDAVDSLLAQEAAAIQWGEMVEYNTGQAMEYCKSRSQEAATTFLTTLAVLHQHCIRLRYERRSPSTDAYGPRSELDILIDRIVEIQEAEENGEVPYEWPESDAWVERAKDLWMYLMGKLWNGPSLADAVTVLHHRDIRPLLRRVHTWYRREVREAEKREILRETESERAAWNNEEELNIFASIES